MRSHFLLLVVLMFLATGLTFAQNKEDKQKAAPNFSGNWRVYEVSQLTILQIDEITFWNEQKVRSISIEHNEGKFSVSILDEFDNIALETELLTNGEGETNISPFRIYNSYAEKIISGYESFKSKTKQDERTIISKAEIELILKKVPYPIIRTVEWKLSNDGKELVEKVLIAKKNSRGIGYNNPKNNITFTRKYKLVE